MSHFEEKAARFRDAEWLAIEPSSTEAGLWSRERLADAYFAACYDRRNLILTLDSTRKALRELIAAMDDNPSPNGICDWSDGEHKAVEQARDILGVVSDS
jgi:hypothetical protein